MVLISCRKGPWSGQAHFSQLRDTVVNYTTFFDASETTFQVIYPNMVVDFYKGQVPNDYGSAEHMQFMFEKFKYSSDKS